MSPNLHLTTEQINDIKEFTQNNYGSASLQSRIPKSEKIDRRLRTAEQKEETHQKKLNYIKEYFQKNKERIYKNRSKAVYCKYCDRDYNQISIHAHNKRIKHLKKKEEFELRNQTD